MIFILSLCLSIFSKFSITNEFFKTNAIFEKDDFQKKLGRRWKKAREKEDDTPETEK